MIRLLFRAIAWIALLIGLGLAVRDLIRWYAGGSWDPQALGSLWFALDPASLNLLQAVVQRYLLPEIWDPGLVWLLLLPAFAVFLALAVLLGLLTGRRDPYRGRGRGLPH